MVSNTLPGLFTPGQGQTAGFPGDPEFAGYAVYSYMRFPDYTTGNYTFNKFSSSRLLEDFEKPLPELWLRALPGLMQKAGEEDAGVIRAGHPLEYTTEFQFNGRSCKFLVSKFPFRLQDGGVVLLGSFRNVTYFLDNIDEIGSRKVLFSLVAENMSEVFCVLDMNAKLAFVSDSIRKLTGYTADELSAMPVSELLTGDSLDTATAIWESFRQRAKGRQITPTVNKPEQFELGFIRKDGEQRWAEVTAAAFYDPDGKMLGVHGLVRDSTERKARQDAIRSSLKHEIELSNVKSKYISTISHEFRTPLSIIYSNLQLLENNRFELDAETINDAFELSRMAVKSLLRVLDKVTVIDAVNKGKLEFKPSKADLHKLCRTLVRDLNEMEMVPDRIDLVIHPVPDEVWIDESLFGHIFTNLLLNALNFSDKKQRISFEVSMPADGQLLFEICDRGIGIPDDEKEYIFEPFYRTSNARNARGSGLGLAVVRDCLELHKGQVSFESSLGKGSVFRVILPVGRQADSENI